MKIDKDYKEYIYKFDKKDKDDGKANSKTDLDKNSFLKLLTTQLANQDPLNPIEDREFIAQLAQFSSLEQMQNLNKTFTEKTSEMVEALDLMNLNQIHANVEILKEITNMRKSMDAYLGKDAVKDDVVKDDAEKDKENTIND